VIYGTSNDGQGCDLSEAENKVRRRAGSRGTELDIALVKIQSIASDTNQIGFFFLHALDDEVAAPDNAWQEFCVLEMCI
jgi:hypothetical protein